ncbi:MAG: N-acetylmuramoyl-L-alanine amidase [Armatimonadota bacterium]
MKLSIAPRLGLALLALLMWAAIARADTLVVAGSRSRSPLPFLLAGDEIYAPLLPALESLHATYSLTPDQIRITTAAGREILVHRKRPEATRDGALREMPGIPREQKGAILLPAKALGSLLGCAVRWDQASRTLYLHPWIRKFTLEELSDRYRLTVSADAPITYRTGELASPPRLFLDLLNMDLSQIPSAYTVENSYLKGARISQKSLAPGPEGDVARVVVELAERRQWRIGESDDRCKLWVDFPLPDADKLPPDVPPVILTAVAFERTSSRVAQLRLTTYGRAVCTALPIYDPEEIVFDIANARSQLSPAPIEIEDRVVRSVSVAPARRNPGAQRVTIALREPIGHSLQTSPDGVTLLFGQFDLADLRVVLDAGHGGHDTGAVGRAGTEERVVNLDIARRVYEKLLAMGVTVCMTRLDESSVMPWTPGNREQQRQDLLSRCSIANEMSADLFVSIHANATTGNRYEHRGTETYYRKDDSLEFARAMQREVVAQTGLPDGGVIRHPKSIIVISHTDMPAVLVEVAYLSHPADEALLATDEFRERAAQGIVNGIRRYVEEGGLLDRLMERERTAARQQTP